jgi:predicted lipoprotein with Yx(FWY)xxD motif
MMQMSNGYRWLKRAAVAGALAMAAVGGPAAHAQPAAMLSTGSSSELGSFLTDSAGMTLYLYTKDNIGISNCYGGCATAWPPLLTQSASAPTLPEDMPGIIGTTTRTDGALQVTYNGMPLYYWASDKQPGDTTGQNVGGVWFVINPEPAPTVNVRGSGDLGDILVDPRGMTLYLYTKDEPSLSNCYDQCAEAWPPLMTDTTSPSGPDSVAGGLGTTTRTDGSLQVTYNGAPLYYWVKDQKPGDTTGQNVGGVWFVVNP